MSYVSSLMYLYIDRTERIKSLSFWFPISRRLAHSNPFPTHPPSLSLSTSFIVDAMRLSFIQTQFSCCSLFEGATRVLVTTEPSSLISLVWPPHSSTRNCSSNHHVDSVRWTHSSHATCRIHQKQILVYWIQKRDSLPEISSGWWRQVQIHHRDDELHAHGKLHAHGTCHWTWECSRARKSTTTASTSCVVEVVCQFSAKNCPSNWSGTQEPARHTLWHNDLVGLVIELVRRIGHRKILHASQC